ncbi:nucleotide-diphospho-sugar transferase [Ampelomyces quisqualis]|uniref:Nucleotide-diphospho-sugar transferase n=1 Tax=Ampelomyces quisqualis TaxID=50730 RepID=A0A6A5QU28_AMPQU|nr:nucleotide-diphospho-sugar transferase [Ampelomyces quisqualis]
MRDYIYRIPKKIWYKLGPHGMSEDIRNWTSSCINLNPGYEVVFLNDETGDHYVQRFFASRPDIVATYLGLTVPIVKADILRYLLLYNEGGIWSDLDISCEGVPIDEWIPDDYKRRTGLVVGWEFDYGWPGEIVRQFASWTIMAQAGSPHMMQVIEDILEIIHEILEENKVSVENATLAMMGNVVDFSGPRRMTHGIYKSLGKQLNRTIEESDLNQILQPKLVGDVLIMPGRSFAASANTYKPEEAEHLPPKLVTHHYAGTWRNDHGGEV